MNNMPLLREYTQNLRKHEDIVLLHINHDVDNSYRFNEFLETVFDKVIFIPVSYDEDSEHKTRGSFQEHIEEQIERVLSEAVILAVENGKKLIVIEDGGYFLPVYVRAIRKYPSLEGNILGVVEQTTSGTRRTLSHSIKNALGFPCASVARSKVKMNLESIFIGQRVVEELSLFCIPRIPFLISETCLSSDTGSSAEACTSRSAPIPAIFRSMTATRQMCPNAQFIRSPKQKKVFHRTSYVSYILFSQNRNDYTRK